MDKLLKLNGYIQLTAWIVVVIGVLFMIFILNSPHWTVILLSGLVVQIAGHILSLLKRKKNITWLILTLTSLLILSLMYIESSDVIHMHIFHDMQITILSILMMNVLYFVTIFQIIKALRFSYC